APSRAGPSCRGALEVRTTLGNRATATAMLRVWTKGRLEGAAYSVLHGADAEAMTAGGRLRSGAGRARVAPVRDAQGQNRLAVPRTGPEMRIHILYPLSIPRAEYATVPAVRG